MAQNMAEEPDPSSVEEAILLEEEITEISCAGMVGALAGPKVITWENMVSAASKVPSYLAVVKIVLDGGQGPWLAGTEGIRKHREHLSVIDGVVVFQG